MDVFSLGEKGRNLQKTKVEGAYTYYCSSCETVFAVVSRLSVAQDKLNTLTCPKCRNKSDLYGEGNITHERYDQIKEQNANELESVPTSSYGNELADYPIILTAEHIAEILDISRRKAYEIMEWKGFPLLRIDRHKKVFKPAFIEWLMEQKNK